MQTGTIVTRRAGHFPPNAFWEAVLKANPHGWGAAIVDKPGEFLLNSDIEGSTLDDIQDTLKTFEDKAITFQFYNSEVALQRTDLAPYILAVQMDGEDEIPQIVAFVDGNFPTYAKTGSSHPPEYHLAMEYLLPKMESIYDMCEGDLDKVFSQLEKPFFRKDLILQSVSRGTITLVLANGKSLTFHQGDLAAEYPWGWSSNTHGYATEAKKTEAAPAKKPGMFSGKSTVREKANVQPSPAIAEAVKAPETGGAVIKNITVVKNRPDSTLSRGKKKEWYQTRIGYLPPGWADCIEVEIYAKPDGKLLTFSEYKKMGMDAVGLPALNNPKREEGKDTEAHNIPQPEQSETVQKPVTSDKLPIMSPEARKAVKAMMAREDIKKIVADNADIIMDPKRVTELTNKFADFARQLGVQADGKTAVSIDEFLKWDYEHFLELSQSRPDALAVMAWNFRNMIAYHRTKKADKEEKVEETAVVETPPKAKRPGMFAKSAAA